MREYLPLNDAWFYWASLAVLLLSILLFAVLGYNLRNAVAYLRRHWAWIGFSSLLIVVAVHVVMLAPAPPAASHCVERHQVWGPFEMILTCDSFEFIRDARHPGRLSMPGSYRQTRPLQIMAAAGLTLIERPNWHSHAHYIAPEGGLSINGGPCDNCIQKSVGYPYGLHLQPGWLPYVVLNFIILLSGLVLFKRLIAPRAAASLLLTAILAVFLVFNDAVRGFFWSAHLQMWNVTMPLVCVALGEALLLQPNRSWRFFVATGALLGIASLAYASFVVCLPVVMVTILLGFWYKRERPSWLSVAGKLAAFLAAFALPSAVWIKIVIHLTGMFLNSEITQFREFVWTLDSWKAGGLPRLLRDAAVFAHPFFWCLASVIWAPAILLMIALLTTTRSIIRTIAKEHLPIVISALLTAMSCFGFFGLMGFYRSRLEFNIVVPLFVLAGIFLRDILEKGPAQGAARQLILPGLAAFAYITVALVTINWPY